MIDKKRFYWDCREYELQKLAEELGISPSAIQRKMHDPTSKLFFDEYVQICKLLQPELPTEQAIIYYLTETT